MTKNLERNNLAKEIRKAVNTYGVDFSDILLSIEKKQGQKSAQDDSAIAKKMKKLESAKITKKAEDNSKVSSKKPKLSIEALAKKLERVDIDKIKEEKIPKYISSFKRLFKEVKSKFGENHPMLKELDSLIEEISGMSK